jgi:hypothetical protein
MSPGKKQLSRTAFSPARQLSQRKHAAMQRGAQARTGHKPGFALFAAVPGSRGAPGRGCRRALCRWDAVDTEHVTGDGCLTGGAPAVSLPRSAQRSKEAACAAHVVALKMRRGSRSVASVSPPSRQPRTRTGRRGEGTKERNGEGEKWRNGEKANTPSGLQPPACQPLACLPANAVT